MCALPNLAVIAIPNCRIYAAQHSGTRKDPPESNLCSGGSGCISMLPTRSIADLPNSNLWFGKSCYIARQQVEAALRPGCVREAVWMSALPTVRESVWKPHCG